MILREPSISSPSKSPYIAKFLLGVLLLGALVYGASLYIGQSFSQAENDIVFCDAENVKGKFFVTNGIKFSKGQTQSRRKAHSGRFSCRVDGEQKYGLGYELKNVQQGDRYKVSIWRYAGFSKNGILAISAADPKDFYKEITLATQKDENGWELLEHTFNAPSFTGEPFIKIYCYTQGADPVFFDDLKIEKISNTAKTADSTAFEPSYVQLHIADKWMQKLKAKRKEAFKAGLLITGDDDWVKGEIWENEQKIPVKLRLKGDWLDHLGGNKWSFRIRAKTPHAWKRMITFSVQSPHTRSFLNEWVYHQWLEKEDVLSPRYDFFTLQLNEDTLGVYAYEEHFDKQLPEFKARREGPILRFVEDGVWESSKRQFDKFGKMAFPDHNKNSLNLAEITPFRASKTLASPALNQQFEIAQNLMLEYKYGLKPVEAIFDLDKLAAYYAILDIMQAYHGLSWHNQRFYYNPVLNKLEPIGFDGFAEKPLKYHGGPFLGYFVNRDNESIELYPELFKDPAFIEKYTSFLYKFTSADYIQSFLLDMETAIEARITFLKKEYPDVSFDKEALLQNAKKIHEMIAPMNNLSLIVRTQGKTETAKQVKAVNHHYLPLKVIGFGKKQDVMTDSLVQSIFLPSYRSRTLADYTDLEINVDAEYLFYKVVGVNDKIYHSRIAAWKAPEPFVPAQELFENAKMIDSSLFTFSKKGIIFKKGKQAVNKDIIIPVGYKVYIEAGTELHFLKNTKFISRSPVFMYGTSEAPIKIYSEAGTANGITVLQAAEQSQLQYVIFEGLNTLSYKGWQLTGAVTFYESDVVIDHCVFKNNHCEDGLNIIRSTFELNNSLISNTAFDGFDCDFCKGTIEGTRFVETGNDGMDFSGSKITVTNCRVENGGDKGLSVGEEASVKVTSLTIDGAVIGVASKDFSSVQIDNIELLNCTQGFAAYQKKPEFGPATIVVKNYTAENVKFLYKLDTGSSINLKGKKIKGE